jgi:hypothetical protein
MRLLRGAFRGMALGAVVAALACAAYSSQGLHTGIRLLDPLIGVALVLLSLALVNGILGLVAAVVERVLGLVARHGPARASAVVVRIVRVVRLAGRPSTSAVVGIVLILWATPSSGPLAVLHGLFYFEIPIVGWALAGLLAGAGVTWSRNRPVSSLPGTARRRQALTALALVPALLVGGTVGAWAAMPGFGDPLVHEDPTALARIPPLALPDPSQPGPYRVVAVSYGSGSDTHRPEFGGQAAWKTPTVDASAALPAHDSLTDAYERWYWGFDTAHLPLNALAWYPSDAPGPLPLVLIAHGNHDAEESSDPGYAYLGESLASHGMIVASIDENFLNGDVFFDYGGAEMPVRAWMLLRHAAQFAAWNEQPGHPLAGRVDTQRIALIGHSRGGEAAAAAAMIEDEALPIAGMPATPAGLGIRAVVAIAPCDGMYAGPDAPVSLRDLDYLVLQGAHDGDLPGFSGLGTYHRVTFSGGNHLKVALYSARANHGRFNSVWDFGDAGLSISWLLDRGSMLSPAEQQRLAKTAIGAFLARSLQGTTAYDAFFEEPRSGRAWLPPDVVETHWESSARTVVQDFGGGTRPETSGQTNGFAATGARDPGLRDGSQQGDFAAWLRWTTPATYVVPLDASVATQAADSSSLVFSLAPAGDPPQNMDPVVELRLVDGRSADLRVADVAPIRPLLPAQLWKAAGLGDRYLPGEQHLSPVDRLLQTYRVPLAAFGLGSLRPAAIASIGFRFAGAGEAYLDDIAFDA